MSRHLVVNTQVDRPIPRSTSQWQPSPVTSAAIQEEEEVNAIKQRNRTNTLYEEDEDDEDDLDEDELDDEMDEDEDELDEDDDSTFTSSPSIPDENINFDLVYALHTFVATVEGQASVVKGDALTLLDDSNSYWWLVSVLKTSEVGYIPAENIETPFERLARLNKHRNAEMTSMDQAVHYIPNENKKKGGRQRRVTMNKDLSVQAQIILTGDDEDHEVGEAYEEWEEDMADDASMLSEYGDDDDDDDDDSIQEDKERNVSSNIVGVPQLQDQERNAAAPKSTTAAPQPILRSNSNNNNNNNNAVSSSSTSSSSTATTSSSGIRNVDDKRPPNNTFWRLFSRNKKDNPKANSVIPVRVSSEDADSNSISSLASSIVSEDKTISRNGQHPNTASNNHTNNSNSNSKLSVLRVFAGNVNVGAMYHSMLVDEYTSAEQLLIQTMERFHIAQIEDKTAGRSSRAITPTNGSGIEYYLTVKAHNGDEIILAPQDKPLAIFQTLTAHLTTPMPSLAHVKQFSQSAPDRDINVNKPKTAPARKGRFGEDSVIRFYLHKRIRRVNEREGQVYIKVSHYTDTKKTVNGNDNALFSAKNLRRKKPSAADASRERIDKLIAISASISIGDLTEVALEKFHIVPHDNDHYRLTVSSQQKADKHLNPSSKLIEVLHDDDSTRDAGEKLFTLKKMSGHHHHHHSQSRSASRESQRSISKVSPEKTQRRPQNYQRSPLSINIRTEKTEDALRRLDAALTALSNDKRKPATDAKPPMAVIRNVDSGVDIILANGLLSSKILSKNQAQYTVSVNMSDQQQPQSAKPRLVAQKIMQQPLVNGNRPINSSLKNVTENDLDTLIKSGIAFLEAHDRKSGRKPVPSALAGTGAVHGNVNGAPSLDIVDSSAGSLDDLEKEFQRIIASHAF